MKNIKMLFLISLFGCFILPGFIGIFSALSIFFDISGFISDWILVGGGIWLLIVYQFVIILITIMLYLTLRLKDAQAITTDDVVKGKKSQSTIKKVGTIDIDEISAPQRKEVKKLEKRDIIEEEEFVAPAPVKEVKAKSVPSTVSSTISNQAPAAASQPSQPKKIYSAIKK